MSLNDLPDRGSTKVYDDEGSTRVPEAIRDGEGIEKGDKLEWVSEQDEEFVRLYPDEGDKDDDDSAKDDDN